MVLLNLVYTISGFALLVWGADRFVSGAAGLAILLGMPPVIIGVTIVGFGTSAPELMVSASAAAQGLTPMAVGNALGSNIANVGLVLGTAAIIRPISSELTGNLRREIPLLILLTALTALLFLDHELSTFDALLLCTAFLVFMGWIISTGLRARPAGFDVADYGDDIPTNLTRSTAGMRLLIGLIVLLASANLLVYGAENLAREFGVSELVIGLTVIAIGTSLPELAVSVVGAFRGDADIAVGNIIGSNVFNLLAVIGVAGLVQPTALDSSVMYLHYPVMALFTLVLLRIAYNPFGKPGFGRGMGIFLLAAFIGYQAILLSGKYT